MPNFDDGMIYQPFMTVIICLLSIFVKYNANNQSHTGNLYANNCFILYVITLSNEERYTPATTVKSTMSIESGVYGCMCMLEFTLSPRVPIEKYYVCICCVHKSQLSLWLCSKLLSLAQTLNAQWLMQTQYISDTSYYYHLKLAIISIHIFKSQ